MIDIKLITPQMLPLSKIELNKGQIPDVPQNPRFIRDERYKKLVNSIETHPEMMGYRELWVFPFNGKYAIIGGNMRFRALRDLGYKEAPCKVLPPETPADDLRQFILLDNAEYGENDMDIMLNEFETADLELAGIELNFDTTSPDDFGEEFQLPEGDKEPFQQMAFMLADEQAMRIKQAIEDIKQTDEYKYAETFGNQNSNGNALYLIVSQWVDAKK